MAATTTRPPRLPNGTRVHVRSDHFVEECDAVIRQRKTSRSSAVTGISAAPKAPRTPECPAVNRRPCGS